MKTQKHIFNSVSQKTLTTGSPFFIQPKLTIGQPNDIYEQQADATADKIMRMPEQNFIHRKCAECEKEDENTIQRREINNCITPFIQTKSESNSVANDSVSNSINATRGSGNALNGETKSFMESRFCADFSEVNIHTGSDSIQMNRELNAQAFTVGSDIYFNEGKFQPHTDSGKHLLAHELTHVVQQSGNGNKQISRKKIEYGQLTWDNFKGTVPTKTEFGAETYSGIEPFNFSILNPKLTEEDTKEECTLTDSTGAPVMVKGVEKKSTKRKVTVALDSEKVKIKPYMLQEKSWVKPWATSEKGMEKKCKEDVVAPCEKAFKDLFKTNESTCKQSCIETVAGGGSASETDSAGTEITASNKKECSGKYLTACSDNANKRITVTMDTGESLTDIKDCSKTILDNCKQKMIIESDDLLSHEQGHFDITQSIALNTEKDIVEIISQFQSQEFIGCGTGAALKAAKAEMKNSLSDQIKNIIEDAQNKYKEKIVDKKVKGVITEKSEFSQMQDDYDDETNHGLIADKQSDWKNKIYESMPYHVIDPDERF